MSLPEAPPGQGTLRGDGCEAPDPRRCREGGSGAWDEALSGHARPKCKDNDFILRQCWPPVDLRSQRDMFRLMFSQECSGHAEEKVLKGGEGRGWGTSLNLAWKSGWQVTMTGGRS